MKGSNSNNSPPGWSEGLNEKTEGTGSGLCPHKQLSLPFSWAERPTLMLAKGRPQESHWLGAMQSSGEPLTGLLSSSVL